MMANLLKVTPNRNGVTFKKRLFEPSYYLVG